MSRSIHKDQCICDVLKQKNQSPLLDSSCSPHLGQDSQCVLCLLNHLAKTITKCRTAVQETSKDIILLRDKAKIIADHPNSDDVRYSTNGSQVNPWHQLTSALEYAAGELEFEFDMADGFLLVALEFFRDILAVENPQKYFQNTFDSDLL